MTPTGEQDTAAEHASEQDRLSDTKRRILAILDAEHALVKPEALARLAEGYHHHDSRNVDPHVTGVALQELEQEGRVVTSSTTATRGGTRIATIQPADQRRRNTAIAKAAARKRLLYARYLGWARGTERYPHGLIGPAGERAVRAAIVESAAMQPHSPSAGPIREILGVRLNGAADSGGYMIPMVAGLPQPPVTVLVEVKSIREWIYPTSSELYQVLHKCAWLKQNHPDVPVVPMLICRRAHKTTFFMAKQLGFIVIEMAAQFVGDTVEEQPLLEVRNGLAFLDLYRGSGPSLRVRDRLRDHLGPHIQDFANTWTATMADTDIPAHLGQLRQRLSSERRTTLLNSLRSANRTNGGRGGW